MFHLGQLGSLPTCHHVHFDVPSNLELEHLINKSSVYSPHVLQAEGHNLVVVEPPISDEGYLFLVGLVHLYLIVS